MSKATEIAEERLAKGEISTEEFENIISKLSNSESHHQKHSVGLNGADAKASIRRESTQNNNIHDSPLSEHREDDYLYSKFSKWNDLSWLTKMVKNGTIIYLISSFFILKKAFSASTESEYDDLLVYIQGSAIETHNSYFVLDAFNSFLGAAVYIFGCILIYKAVANLYALRVQNIKFTPAWSVGWFFIPVANMWKPYQVMSHLWRASRYGDNWQSYAPDNRIIFWFLTFLISNIVAILILSGSDTISSINELIAVRGAILITVIFEAASMLLFVHFMKGIAEAQRAFDSVLN